MAPIKTIPCKFFMQGLCRNGDSCDFIHERNTSNQNQVEPLASAILTIEKMKNNLEVATHLNGKAKSTRICIFFVQGLCNKGDRCQFAHPRAAMPPQQVHPDTVSLNPYLGQPHDSSPQTPSDSRARITCKFLSRPGGCHNESCPYLHAGDDHEVEKSNNQDFEISEDEDQDREDDFTRDLSGTLVYFNQFGHILKVSLPTDFSLACITGLAPGITPEEIVDIICGLDFNINIHCVRIHAHTMSSETKATVKVEDPLFAKELSARLKDQRSVLSATPIPINARRTNCRKVYISWHKAARNVWMNFGNGEIANRVAQKFNEGRYKCLGQSVKASPGKRSLSRVPFSYNPVSWTISLSDLPDDATSENVEKAIISPHDKPRHIEMGSISYRASDAEVSVEVRSHLEEHGRLESFYLAPTPKGKRVKAAAWFQDEADARSACSLNNRPLDILRNGKITVTLVQSAKVKISTTIYFASKGRIDEESKTWRERHLAFHVYPDTSQRFRTLKVEGDNTKDLAKARKTLDEISSGVVLTDGKNVVWSSALSDNNGSAYQNLKSIEAELHIVVNRVKSKRQLQFYGPPEKYQQAVRQITNILREESSTSFEIDLKPHQFSRMVQGGFRSIEQALGKNVAIFNVVLKRISVNGTQQQYEVALAIIDGKHAVEIHSPSDGPSMPEGDCTICFCDANTPIQTSCKHIYCLECFEDCCKSAASTIKNEFQIKCHGDAGTCSNIFTLREVKDYLSSSVFEIVLKSSFEQYIQRHPEAFHYCPTPDCGYVYRCTTASGSKPAAYTCQNCLEPICTSCHAKHGDYTCAEYKDIASGGYEALERLKKELNIKDCPKCTTPMEKTEGCNHMTCGGCKAHICWVCMEVFKTSGPCYEHMNRKHGGIGLGYQHLRFGD